MQSNKGKRWLLISQGENPGMMLLSILTRDWACWQIYFEHLASRNVDTHILSIPGIAEISAGSIIAEFGDIKNFESPEKMLAFAGLEPSIRQSGTLSTEGHMVKHGSGYLRNTIMRVVNSLVMHDQVFYDYYNKKRDEGKHHLVAQSHVAKKLIRIIYTLEIKDIDYDINFVK